MRMIGKKLVAAMIAAAAWASGGAAQALELGLNGGLGYDTTQFPGNLEMTGFELMGGLLVPFTRVAGGPVLLGGANLKIAKVKGSKDGVSHEMDPMTLGLGGGFGFGLGSKVRLETLLTYDFGLTGDYKVGGQSGKLDGYRRLNHDWRLYFDVFPRTDIGFGINWYTATFDWKDNSDLRHQGFVLRALLSHSL